MTKKRRSRQPRTDSAKTLNQDLVAELVQAGDHLDEALVTAITARGAAIIPDLAAIVEDDNLTEHDAPGDGYVPVHAADLLRELHATDAAESLLRALLKCDPLDLIYSSLVEALQSFGTSVCEQALQFYGSATNNEQRQNIATVLAGLKLRDDRILSILLDLLEKQPDLGASLLCEYGDEKALPHLVAKLDGCKIDPDRGILRHHHIIELAAAIEELGGTLTDSQWKLQEEVRALSNPLREMFKRVSIQHQTAAVEKLKKDIKWSQKPPVPFSRTISLM